jgi:hypothetical protein
MYFSYLTNILNEVLCGFHVDHESVLGVNRNRLEELFKKARARDREEPIDLRVFSSEEAQMLLKCSQLCMKELEGWEFDTRLGVSREEANETNRMLSGYIDSHGEN